MSLVSAVFPPDPYREQLRTGGKGGLLNAVLNAGRFLRELRTQLRFGELSRAPLKLLRFQLEGNTVECDWLARLPDAWDADLSQRTRQRHATLQTLRDAIDIRALIFEALPKVEIAYFRVYRDSPDYLQEMIVTGCAQRNDNSSRAVHSIVMRAKILGFRFRMEGDALRKL